MEVKHVPTHVAFIADGNRRWAKNRNLPTFEGHRRGYERINELVHAGREMGIQIMTFWVFSTENWQRTKKEVGYLMKLFTMMIDKHIKEAHERKTRMIHLGRKDRIPDSLRNKIYKVETETASYTQNYLCVAIDYGGEDELMRTIVKLPRKSTYTREDIFSHLDTHNLPQQEVDLVIRTSGEQRTSGFLPLQTAYSEYIFSPQFFPDFGKEELEKAIRIFNERKRRFGI